MKTMLQFLLDHLENLTTRLHLHGLTFRILQLKRRLGLNYHR